MGSQWLTPEQQERLRRSRCAVEAVGGTVFAAMGAAAFVGNVWAAFFDPLVPAPWLAALGAVVAGFFGLGSALVAWDAIRGKY